MSEDAQKRFNPLWRSDIDPPHDHRVLVAVKNGENNHEVVIGVWIDKFKKPSETEYETNDEFCESDNQWYIASGWYREVIEDSVITLKRINNVLGWILCPVYFSNQNSLNALNIVRQQPQHL